MTTDINTMTDLNIAQHACSILDALSVLEKQRFLQKCNLCFKLSSEFKNRPIPIHFKKEDL